MLASHPLRKSLLTSLLWERKGWKGLVLLIGLVGTLLGLSAPFFQKSFIDGLLAGAASTERSLLIRDLIFGFIASFGAVSMSQLAIWLAAREAVFSLKSISDAMYSRLLSVRGGLVGKAPSGEAVSLFTVDASGSIQILEQSLPMSSSLLFPLLLAPYVLQQGYGIPYSQSLLALGVLLLINLTLAIRQSRFFYHFKQLAQERTGRVNEWIQNIRTLRILGWTTQTEEKILQVRRRETANRLAMVTNGQIMNAISGSSPTFLNLLAVGFWIQGRESTATPGEILSLVWLVNVFLTKPLRQFPWILVMGMDASSSMRRLDQAFKKEFQPSRVLHPSPVTPFVGAVPSPGEPALEIRGLELMLEQRPALKSIHLRLYPRECVAIVGEVGSGKSLLLQSLLGETAATFLSFKLDGQETRGPVDPSVKQRFAYVPQEGFTMSASLRENVLFTYRAESNGDAEVLRSLHLSQFDPASEGLVAGLESEIGERGVNLSGGQRQRIGLARAHYAQKPIVLLDDPLSAVDVETEKKLLETLLRGAWRDRPRLLVTHRMSILPHCDRVLFMEDGRIRMEGTYEELLKNDSFRAFVQTAAQEATGEITALPAEEAIAGAGAPLSTGVDEAPA